MSLYFTPTKRKPTQTLIDKAEECRAKECEICPLNDVTTSFSKEEPSGNLKPLVLVLSETPQDHQGKFGRLLRENLSEIEEYCRFNTIVRTQPKDPEPTWEMIECCRPSIIRDIEASKPAAILAVGPITLKWLTGETAMMAWRGRRFPVKIGTHICWVYPVMTPKFVLRRIYGGPDLEAFKNDVAQLVDDVIEDLPKPELEDDPLANLETYSIDATLELYKSRFKNEMPTALLFKLKSEIFGEVEEFLVEAAEAEVIAIDIETTALRPYGDGVIRTISISTPERNFAFSYHAELHMAVRSLLLSKKPIKVAQNMGFELEWFAHFFGAEVVRSSRWEDTQAQAYCLDERVGALSLNSLCIQYFGLRLKGLSDIDVTKIASAPMEPLLTYNALDTKYTLKLWYVQKKRIEDEGLQGIYEEHLRRIPTVVLTQNRGLLVDQEVAKKNFIKLTERLVELIASMRGLDCIKKFEGAKEGVIGDDGDNVQFNPASPTQVLFVFKDILGFDKELKKQGRYSTDKTILPKLKHPLAKLIIEFRNIQKLRGTYVEGFILPGTCPDPSKRFPPKKVGRELWQDGKIHTNYTTMFTTTGRLSSRNPNLQNLPMRHDKYIRAQFIPEEGNIFISCDYGQIEARLIGAASKDKVLCEAVRNRYDIHMDWAERLAKVYPKRVGGEKFLDDQKVMKTFRTDVKNQFVFPAFYGATEDSIANYLNIPLDYCESIFKDFWDTFSGVKAWQKELLEFYKEHGYVETFTGRRRRAPLSKNEIINSPIQGGASDIVVDAMNRLSERAQFDNHWHYQAVLNVHDDLTFSVSENKVDDHLAEIVFHMLDCPYKFITVPLSVEASIGPNLFEMKDAGTFFSDDF